MNVRKWLGLVAAVAAFCAAMPASATNLIINGDFELTTLPGSFEFGTGYPANQVTGWNTDGYNFIMAPGTADVGGSTGAYGNLILWGPANGSANGLTATSPVGGNYVAADGGLPGLTLPITQTVSGLNVGSEYLLTFWWAAAQQYGFNSITTENWIVDFGSENFTTPIVTNANHGFVPWRKTTYVFTPTSTTQTLSFLANGTPVGQPPFSLLDGVSLEKVAVPEPATWAMMLLGFGIVGASLRGRRGKTDDRGLRLSGIAA